MAVIIPQQQLLIECSHGKTHNLQPGSILFYFIYFFQSAKVGQEGADRATHKATIGLVHRELDKIYSVYGRLYTRFQNFRILIHTMLLLLGKLRESSFC